MTKQYRDYIEQLKTACQQNEVFSNTNELIPYVDAKYAELSKIHADCKKYYIW